MRVSIILLQLLQFLLPPALIVNTLLYLYPVLYNCQFPVARRSEAACLVDSSQKGIQGEAAPFRLLAFGDPQLEGDTSLPGPHVPLFPSIHELYNSLSNGPWSDAPQSFKTAVKKFGVHDIPWLVYRYRKRLDLIGNDYYLRHVYRSVRWWTGPTHMTVLGDLLGSQWIRDGEFAKRSDRFWNRAFKGAERVPDAVMVGGTIDDNGGHQQSVKEVLGGSGTGVWKSRLINIAGNHDIGYAGDIDERRIERFERAFGKVNWDIRFQLPPDESRDSAWNTEVLDDPPELRLVILNSMNLDSPAFTKSLQDDTMQFLEWEGALTTEQRAKDATILLTHIPLYKDAGICTDGPLFNYFPDINGAGVAEQNHLSRKSSDLILDELFPATAHCGPKCRPRGIILNGHDHEGCATYHYQKNVTIEESSQSVWHAEHPRYVGHIIDDESVHGIKEITVRSMMGSYGGNVGLLSAWFDQDLKQWQFNYATCPFAIQHIWWGVHIFDLIMIGLALAFVGFGIMEVRQDRLQELQSTRVDSTKKKA